MSEFSNESCSRQLCAEVTLPFVLPRSDFKKSRRRTRGTFMSEFSNESFSQQLCAEVTLPFVLPRSDFNKEEESHGTGMCLQV